MKRLKKWGVSFSSMSYNGALINAASNGHIDCMKLAKEWGATDYDCALAYSRGHIDCTKLVEEWILQEQDAHILRPPTFSLSSPTGPRGSSARRKRDEIHRVVGH